MNPQQTSLFGDAVSSVRKHDPRTAKAAAAHDPNGRELQRLRILRFLIEHGPASADECARVIERHRSVASTRLNVLRRAGLTEKCGLARQPDAYGRMRDVELHRVTEAGRAAA